MVPAIYRHVLAHKWVAAGLALAQRRSAACSCRRVQVFPDRPRVCVWRCTYGGLAGFVATGLGALPALLLRRLPQRIEDSMLGLAAGMMLAASAFSLLLPGLSRGFPARASW